MERRWKRSTWSEGANNCVEVTTGAVRDSKNPAGQALRVDLGPLVAAVKANRVGR